MNGVLGWDIGGVNTKVARVEGDVVIAVRIRPFEIQHAPDTLAQLLGELARAVGAQPRDAHAVTMTAELSQVFRTKGDGVAFVLDQVEAAFPDALVRVYAVDGTFASTTVARDAPLSVAAANWAATARLVARTWPDAMLVDTGSTTTDIIPIVAGEVAATGRTDPERLSAGELVYTGAVRTPVEAIAATVPYLGRATGVSAEGFALAGDVHLWRGQLPPGDYSVPTPDGRPATRAFAAERLARVVCADRTMLDDAGVSAIADAVWQAQVARIAHALRRVAARHPTLLRGPAVVAGLGDFLAAEAARRAGLRVTRLAERLNDAGRHAPAAAVALLLAGTLAEETIHR